MKKNRKNGLKGKVNGGGNIFGDPSLSSGGGEKTNSEGQQRQEK